MKREGVRHLSSGRVVQRQGRTGMETGRRGDGDVALSLNEQTAQDSSVLAPEVGFPCSG